MLAGGRPSLRLVPQTAREPQAFARPRQWRKSDSILKRFKRTSQMNGNLKFRIGDTVYHKTLDLWPRQGQIHLPRRGAGRLRKGAAWPIPKRGVVEDRTASG